MLTTQKTAFKPRSPAVFGNCSSKRKTHREGESDGITFRTITSKASICESEIWDVMTLGELLLTYLIMQQQDLQEHNHTVPLGMLPVHSTND